MSAEFELPDDPLVVGAEFELGGATITIRTVDEVAVSYLAADGTEVTKSREWFQSNAHSTSMGVFRAAMQKRDSEIAERKLKEIKTQMEEARAERARKKAEQEAQKEVERQNAQKLREEAQKIVQEQEILDAEIIRSSHPCIVAGGRFPASNDTEGSQSSMSEAGFEVYLTKLPRRLRWSGGWEDLKSTSVSDVTSSAGDGLWSLMSGLAIQLSDEMVCLCTQMDQKPSAGVKPPLPPPAEAAANTSDGDGGAASYGTVTLRFGSVIEVRKYHQTSYSDKVTSGVRIQRASPMTADTLAELHRQAVVKARRQHEYSNECGAESEEVNSSEGFFCPDPEPPAPAIFATVKPRTGWCPELERRAPCPAPAALAHVLAEGVILPRLAELCDSTCGEEGEQNAVAVARAAVESCRPHGSEAPKGHTFAVPLSAACAYEEHSYFNTWSKNSECVTWLLCFIADADVESVRNAQTEGLSSLPTGETASIVHAVRLIDYIYDASR